MAAVQSLRFRDWKGTARTVSFMADVPSLNNRLTSRFQATVVTGRNGSHKSTLLKALVAGLVLPLRPSPLQLVNSTNLPPHVVCLSGSVADRFPLKETNGRSTEYDVPSYLYLGQRVGVNMLSKKKPIETMLTHMLDTKKFHRIGWPFFERAHELAGVGPYVEYELTTETSATAKLGKPDLLSMIGAIAAGDVPEKSSPLRNISEDTAVWLVQEFEATLFEQLSNALASSARKIRVVVGPNGPNSERLSVSAIRLGLLTDFLKLVDAQVTSRLGNESFAATELSSGEYHMFTSLMGLGFGIEEGSVVLIDEPENSLHPQWQQDFMEAVIEICTRAASHGHLIICTHSPLIVSAAPPECTIVDLSENTATAEAAPYGASTDEVLLTKFGIGSSRNRIVVETVQRALSYVERGDFKNPDFLAMASDLRFIRDSLQKDDPLVIVIRALLDEETA